MHRWGGRSSHVWRVWRRGQSADGGNGTGAKIWMSDARSGSLRLQPVLLGSASTGLVRHGRGPAPWMGDGRRRLDSAGPAAQREMRTCPAWSPPLAEHRDLLLLLCDGRRSRQRAGFRAAAAAPSATTALCRCQRPGALPSHGRCRSSPPAGCHSLLSAARLLDAAKQKVPTSPGAVRRPGSLTAKPNLSLAACFKACGRPVPPLRCPPPPVTSQPPLLRHHLSRAGRHNVAHDRPARAPVRPCRGRRLHADLCFWLHGMADASADAVSAKEQHPR